MNNSQAISFDIAANAPSADTVIIVTTQVYENYGAHDWDGVGSCPQYWKPKGGSTFVVRGTSNTTVARFAVEMRHGIDNESFREFVIGVHEVPAEDLELEDWRWSFVPHTNIVLAQS